jgi:hypothetical protein
VWHEFTSSPASTGLPGQEYFAGTHLNPKVTWWNAGGPFFTYLNRAQYLMQQGLPVADVLYFYGDNVPNFVRLKADDPAHVLPGYNYDVTNEDAFLHDIQVEGGRLRGPSAVEWKALALPATSRISLAVLQRAEHYVAQGGTLIGLAPRSTTGRETDETGASFNALVEAMWGDDCTAGSSRHYKRGLIFCTTNARSALTAMNLAPDVDVADDRSVLSATSSSGLDYVHQRIGDIDLYFLRNGSDQVSGHSITFRIAGELPEVWDATTGEMHAAPGAKLLANGYANVSLELAPFGSSILVFSKDFVHPNPPSIPKLQSIPVEVVEPWSISFQSGRGAPQRAIETTTLRSWTEWNDPGVRYFSGTGTYRASITAPRVTTGTRVWLRFSDVREIARVTINGKDAGTVWAKPLMLRVDQFIKPGENKIEIEVTNLWPNRIIGDQQPEAREHFTSTNITEYKADSPLIPSGLIGPVEWVIGR